jgi:hypothetical protein
MAAPIFSDQQVLCGPFVPDGVGAKGWPSLSAGRFDVRDLQYDLVEAIKVQQALIQRGFSIPHAGYPNLSCLDADYPPDAGRA